MGQEYILRPSHPPPDLQIDYARELNPQQLAAVTAGPGPALVIAGAGSGKTRTLTYRVAYLLEHGVPPANLLLLTFTNKAAGEMMNRVRDLVSVDLSALWGGTFHAIGNRILRRHAPKVGYSSDFTILDRDDSKGLISDCLKELGEKKDCLPDAGSLQELFSLSVNMEEPLAGVVAVREREFEQFTPEIERLRQRYTERKQAAGLMDFDDLLELWLRLFRENPPVCEHYQVRFEHVLVDEYQDTNHLQNDLVELLAARNGNLMAVGDDSQSIYSWRGADFQNILGFPKRHPGTRVFLIETNYRSIPEILELANAVIAPSAQKHPKQLAPWRKTGHKPILVPCTTAAVQARFVAQRVMELREDGRNLSQIAVLYRSHFHALELQLELRNHGIPFTITSGIRFFEQSHIKDLAAWLRLVANPMDELAFKRLAVMLPGIGEKAAAKLWSSTRAEDGQPLARTAAALAGKAAHAVPKKAAGAWSQLTATLEQIEAPEVRDEPATLTHLILEAGYKTYIEQNYDNPRRRLDDLEQLSVFAGQFHSLEDFLSQIALLTNVEAEAEYGAAQARDSLRLSTVHQAKGLEFEVVFVIMLSDGMFPSRRSSQKPEDLEEERRLLYVAITRAKDQLYLSYPHERAAGSDVYGPILERSRFLKEVPRCLYEEMKLIAWMYSKP